MYHINNRQEHEGKRYTVYVSGARKYIKKITTPNERIPFAHGSSFKL